MTGSTIFITAILARSGTNYLSQLLRLHPQCRPPKPPFYEDMFLKNSKKLVGFAQDLKREYADNGFPDTEGVDERMLRAIGDALLGILRTNCPRDCHLVTKSPLAWGLENFPLLFPDQKLVCLLRDGRSVVRSLSTSFAVEPRVAIENWTKGARHFLRVYQRLQSRMLLVRYEKLVEHPVSVARALVERLGLDPGAYPFHRIDDMPVYGSSETSTDGHVDWTPRVKTPGFNPIDRHRQLSGQDTEIFFELAGDLHHRLRDLPTIDGPTCEDQGRATAGEPR